MGVDYDPILIAGWKIEIPEDVTEPDEWMNDLAKKVGLAYSKGGDGSYGGEDRWYITYTEPDLTLDKLKDLSRAVYQAEGLFKLHGIVFQPFEIAVDLYVW